MRFFIDSKKERIGGPGIGGPQMVGLPPGAQGMGIQSQPGVPDPINALQNLARQGTTASGVIPSGPQMQMASGVNQQPHPGKFECNGLSVTLQHEQYYDVQLMKTRILGFQLHSLIIHLANLCCK